MSYNRNWRTLDAAQVVFVAAVLTLVPGAWAQGNYKTLYAFTGGADGWAPYGGLIFDAAGNLYGTTTEGGTHGGVVFKLTRKRDGSWTERVLYSFTDGADGGGPRAGLIFDQAGNLYGTTAGGGNLTNCSPGGCGVVFKLTPNRDGNWTESVLYSFAGGADGAVPTAGLTVGPGGNLYGTTYSDGTTYSGRDASRFCDDRYDGCGVVFELSPKPNGSWKEKVLHHFTGADGGNPLAGLILDQSGNLYGTTVLGGALAYGTVFKLTPSSDGSWKEKVLRDFDFNGNGANPSAGLIFDRTGNLYGTTFDAGGSAGYCCGVAFMLSPSQDGWTENVLYSFSGPTHHDGAQPLAGLTFDRRGNLYGTTQNGGKFDNNCFGFDISSCGVVFRLTPNSEGGWSEKVLHSFGDDPGAQPVAGLIVDAAGNLYGTTQGDGYSTYGSVFEITP